MISLFFQIWHFHFFKISYFRFLSKPGIAIFRKSQILIFLQNWESAFSSHLRFSFASKSVFTGFCEISGCVFLFTRGFVFFWNRPISLSGLTLQIWVAAKTGSVFWFKIRILIFQHKLRLRLPVLWDAIAVCVQSCGWIPNTVSLPLVTFPFDTARLVWRTT